MKGGQTKGVGPEPSRSIDRYRQTEISDGEEFLLALILQMPDDRRFLRGGPHQVELVRRMALELSGFPTNPSHPVRFHERALHKVKSLVKKLIGGKTRGVGLVIRIPQL